MDGWLDGWYFTHRYDDDNNDDEIVQGKGRGGGGVCVWDMVRMVSFI